MPGSAQSCRAMAPWSASRSAPRLVGSIMPNLQLVYSPLLQSLLSRIMQSPRLPYLKTAFPFFPFLFLPLLHSLSPWHPRQDKGKDSESLDMKTRTPHWRMILNQAYCTSAVKFHNYPGQGTEEDPYIVGWLEGDNRNLYNWPLGRRAFITCCISGSSLAAARSSSAYTGFNIQITQEFCASNEVLVHPSLT
jgi:hypothetical protein